MKGNAYLVFTTFVSGAIVMVLELIGSRVIGPPFGVSLFVWTSLITVTLVSLAAGYWSGGWIAEKKGDLSVLFAIILAAGGFTFLIPIIKGFVIEHSLSLGLRGGSLASSVVLFAPPLVLLGMVTPFTVKIYMSGGREGVGKTVGWLYAVSTCGSFVGTVLTGFVLIPSLGVNNIIYASAFVLASLSAGYWLLLRRRPHLILIAALAASPVFFPSELPSVIRKDGTKASLLASMESAYGQVKIVDYSYRDEHIREMLLDNMIQGGLFMKSGLALYKYTYDIERLAIAYGNGARRALVIGLGVGIVPERFRGYYGIRTDVVEINPDVVEASQMYFGFDPVANPTHVEDGRYFLKSEGDDYDIVVLDAFSGDTTPGHLLSVEAFGLVRQRMTPEGVLVINFVAGNTPEEAIVPESLYRTLKAAFPFVDVYANREFLSKTPVTGNLTFVAYLKERASIDTAPLKAPVPQRFRDDIEGVLGRKLTLAEGPILFTDDFNPIDFHDYATRENFRRYVISSTDRSILVH